MTHNNKFNNWKIQIKINKITIINVFSFQDNLNKFSFFKNRLNNYILYKLMLN
jgi:hypothetical protein